MEKITSDIDFFHVQFGGNRRNSLPHFVSGGLPAVVERISLTSAAEALEDENARLKKLLAERCWTGVGDAEACRSKNGDVRTMRSRRCGSCSWGYVSQHRACQALSVDHSSVRYTTIRPDDAPLRDGIKAVAAERLDSIPQDSHHAGPAGHRHSPSGRRIQAGQARARSCRRQI